jgi:hypothetical protein
VRFSITRNEGKNVKIERFVHLVVIVKPKNRKMMTTFLCFFLKRIPTLAANKNSFKKHGDCGIWPRVRFSSQDHCTIVHGHGRTLHDTQDVSYEQDNMTRS